MAILLGSLAAASAGTWVGQLERVEAVEGSGLGAQLEVLRGPPGVGPHWRIGPELEALARTSFRVRWRAENYDGEAWLSHLWPLDRESAEVLVAPRFWVEAEMPGEAAADVLGVTTTGALLRLGPARFPRGALVVPYLPTGAAEQVPAAVARAAALRAYLQPTVHRDFPVVLWSLDPAQDVHAHCAAWGAAAFADAAEPLWVTGLEELQDRWRRRLGVALAAVEGQPPLSQPTLLLLGADGTEWWRYEGRDWPHARIEAALDGLEARVGQPGETPPRRKSSF